ncbi:unnamed protein product [Trichogramma brassicae]|uniref:Uncharacterized protein n=1 Tax=Trichogramma brassicae TaxID=86971 RepID=A0A6H5IW68_9HYME|nr:unnamed protein product [Trichogramma brassicae]
MTDDRREQSSKSGELYILYAQRHGTSDVQAGVELKNGAMFLAELGVRGIRASDCVMGARGGEHERPQADAALAGRVSFCMILFINEKEFSMSKIPQIGVSRPAESEREKRPPPNPPREDPPAADGQWRGRGTRQIPRADGARGHGQDKPTRSSYRKPALPKRVGSRTSRTTQSEIVELPALWRSDRDLWFLKRRRRTPQATWHHRALKDKEPSQLLLQMRTLDRRNESQKRSTVRRTMARLLPNSNAEVLTDHQKNRPLMSSRPSQTSYTPSGPSVLGHRRFGDRVETGIRQGALALSSSNSLGAGNRRSSALRSSNDSKFKRAKLSNVRSPSLEVALAQELQPRFAVKTLAQPNNAS